MVDVMYQRQESLGLIPPSEVSIVGCGGVGAWVAIDLAMTGTIKLNLFDSDNLEVHNLNRLPFTQSDIGKPKVEILKDYIQNIRPEAIVIMNGNLSEITKELLFGTVVDCTDRVATQAFIQQECVRKKLLYYRLGYDGHHITIIDGQHKQAPKIKKTWSDGSGQEGYTTVSSWVAPPQVAAGLLTYAICVGHLVKPLNIDIYEIFK